MTPAEQVGQAALSGFAQYEKEIESLRREVEELKKERDHIKQVEFPAKVDKVAEGWKLKLAASQAREQKLREALEKIGEIASPYRDGVKFNYIADLAQEALSIPPDNTALIEFADKVRDEIALRMTARYDECMEPEILGVIDEIRSMMGKLPR